MTRLFRVFPIVTFSVLMLNACGGDQSAGKDQQPVASAVEGNAAGQAEASETPAAVPTSQDINPQDPASLTAGGELRLSVSTFAENWNPRHVDGNNADYSNVRGALLPSFFDFDATGVPTPNPNYVLSADVVSTDPTEVRYRLNPEAVWGDGTAVDGDDMVAVWQACNGENTEFNCVTTEQYAPIDKITMDESKTEVTVTYKSSFPDWSQGYSAPAVINAECIATPELFNNGWSTLDNDCLSGPFKVERFDATQQIMTLVPNERWWGPKPKLVRIIWRAIAPDAVAQAFANGEIDAFDIGSDPDAFQRALRVPEAQVRKAGGPNFRHFTFNSKAGLLQDLQIRQAIVYALDRQSIAASDLAGIDWPVTALNNHLFLQGQEGYVDTALATGLDYDPDKAKALLDEAGWTLGDDGIREKDGKKLIVRFTQIATVKVSENEALQAQSQLRELGIQLDIVTIPTARFGSTLRNHEFEIIAFSWIGTPYAFSGIEQVYGSGSASNYAQLSLPEVDELAQQISTQSDTAKRIELANRVDRILWENVHTLPLYQRPELVATRMKLANYGAFGLSSPSWESIGYLP